MTISMGIFIGVTIIVLLLINLRFLVQFGALVVLLAVGAYLFCPIAKAPLEPIAAIVKEQTDEVKATEVKRFLNKKVEINVKD